MWVFPGVYVVSPRVLATLAKRRMADNLVEFDKSGFGEIKINVLFGSLPGLESSRMTVS